MSQSIAAALPPVAQQRSREVPRWRLYLLRATYLLLIVGLGLSLIPQLFVHEPTSRGVITGVLSGVWLLAFLGLRYPLQMLPLLFFEFAWKSVWMLKYGLPQYLSGARPDTWATDFPAILAGVVLMPLVIPWGHAWRRFIASPADSSKDGASAIRLKVIRGIYLLMLIPGIYIIGGIVLTPAPMERGVFAAMLTALFLLSFLVIRNPLKMLPVLLLEFTWKAIWLAAFGLPQYLSGTGSPLIGEDIVMVGLGPVFFGLLIPWAYVWQNYVGRPAERWR